MDARERFLKFVDRRGDDECWPWLGYLNKKGYGTFLLDGHKISHNRAAYLLFVGAASRGDDIHHQCENPTCVNWVRHLVKLRRRKHSLQHLRTSCIHGHLFDRENTGRNGRRRVCRACDRRAHSEAMARSKSLAKAA